MKRSTTVKAPRVFEERLNVMRRFELQSGSPHPPLRHAAALPGLGGTCSNTGQLVAAHPSGSAQACSSGVSAQGPPASGARRRGAGRGVLAGSR